jgi:hypothetical protein
MGRVSLSARVGLGLAFGFLIRPLSAGVTAPGYSTGHVEGEFGL